MKKTFLVCSLTGRLKDLIRLITSLSEYVDWNIDVILQKYSMQEEAIVSCHLQKVFGQRFSLINTDEMTGPHLARCRVLDMHTSDVWCILDDDMFAVTGYTFYDKMADIISSRSEIGILS